VVQVAANLNLLKETHPQPEGATRLQVIDGFTDEGHRIGAYYLARAMSAVFYKALEPTIALRVAQQWLLAMEADENIANIAKFEDKTNDLFRFLPEIQRQSSEIRFLKLIHKLYWILNAFTLPVDAMLNAIFSLPLTVGDTTEDGGPRSMLTVLREQVPNAAADFFGACRLSLNRALVCGLRVRPLSRPLRCSRAAPDFISFSLFAGRLEELSREPPTHAAVDGATGLDAVSFLSLICQLDRDDPLGCDAFMKLRTVLNQDERDQLFQATQRKWVRRMGPKTRRTSRDPLAAAP
jgi:hypothetical protein